MKKITLTSSPSSFLLESSTAGINDAGDQARFLANTGPENLVNPFRHHSVRVP